MQSFSKVLVGLILVLSAAFTFDNLWADRLNETDSRFETLVLSEEFHSEGCAVADLDGDGHADIVSGPYWYAGPEFRKRTAYAEVKDYSIKAYSDHFFSFTQDFDGDGDLDILSIPIPGQAAYWYQNPGEQLSKQNGAWTKRIALADVGNESPLFVDLTGDGKAELVCIHNGSYGFASPADDPSEPWKFQPITAGKSFGAFTHGLGIGDVNGDGRNDLIETNGWWQQPAKRGEPFKFHSQRFAESGGAQMLVADLDGDGDNDVVSVQNAHGYGLCWFERRGHADDDFLFVKHRIMGASHDESEFGLAVSQMHAAALADIDGDGVQDIVTGKRFFAHGGNDPGAFQPAVLLWFRTLRTRSGIQFQPHLIHVRSGVGTQVTVADIDANGHPDIVVGNKLGTFASLNSGRAGRGLSPSDEPLSLIGSGEFAKQVRETSPFSPEEEAEMFLLPDGFEAQLVAAEPEIDKPMNMAFDHRGRLWVTSSQEYPTPASGDQKPRDTIKILDDSTGDGRADRITTFAGGLNIPMGLYPYRDGVICFSIPNILFLRDTDGDDKADEQQILYGPFDTSRDTHGMCNGFTRGFDGWLYSCHGFNNQSDVVGADGNQVEMHSGNTFRMRLSGDRIEHFTHGQVNPFGLSLTPSGDLFTADCHTKPITLLIKGGQYESFGRPHDGVGFVPNVMQHLHGSTGIGGIAFYDDKKFPEAFQGNAFGGNVMTGRVNRNSIRKIGATVSATEESDFLVSSDPWFRPVDVQLGPDGALYVADFYNRIIGHYEVPLDHPGRDRRRGRIWRIVYKGTDRRRDVSNLKKVDKSRSVAITSIELALGALRSENFTRRMLATNWLVDHGEAGCVKQVRQRFLDSTTARVQVHCAWVLLRLGDLKPQDFGRLLQSKSSEVRSHAYQMIAAVKEGSSDVTQQIVAGLSDPDMRVRRSAVLAAKEHANQELIQPLLDLLASTQRIDVHLRHAIRMALRDHLLVDEWFAETTRNLAPTHLPVIADLCLAVKTDAAGKFLVEHLEQLQAVDRSKLSEYLTFCSKFASSQNLQKVVALARSISGDDPKVQEQLLRSMADGLQHRNESLPEILKLWATDLVARELGVDPSDRNSFVADSPIPIAWSYVPFPSDNQDDNCWVTSTKRSSADGEKNSVLHSSFPKGEKRTGIYRSADFVLPDRFQFFIAGHDGYPDKAIGKNNRVVVRDFTTKRILKQWSPPRNDTARRVDWDCKQFAGNRVFVELIDGDTAGAYAWLAVGRFSVGGLNPNRTLDRWQHAASVAERFQLNSVRHVMVDLLDRDNLNAGTSVAVSKAIIASNPSALRSALAESMSIGGVSGDIRNSVVGAICKQEKQTEAIELVFSVASQADQRRIASVLASDKSGIETLVQCVERGKASARVLIDPSMQSMLDALATQDQKKRIGKLQESVPSIDSTLASQIDSRRKSVQDRLGDANAGKQLFEKQCAVCHQVNGQGKQVGPNLDGIGNRGVRRVTEDVFLPNQNIDVAFRSSIIITDDGKAQTGLIKNKNDEEVLLVDTTGKEHRISTDAIEAVRETAHSPMPANFAETLSEQNSQDLFAYLMSLTK